MINKSMKQIYILFSLIAISSLIVLPSAQSYIPPTNAIAHFKTGNGTLSPASYDGTIQMNAGSGINIVTHPSSNNFTITATGNTSPLQSIFCSAGYQVHTINATSGVSTCALVNSTGGSGISSLNGDSSSAQSILGTASQILITDTGASHTLSLINPVIAFSNPGNKTGTTSSIPVMEGISFNVTPKVTGRLVIQVSGIMSNTLVTDGAEADIRYGTGSNPNNGASATGTVCGSNVKSTMAGAGMLIPFSLNCQVTGLTLNTSYWIDLGQSVIAGGTASLSNLNVSVIER